MWSQIETATPGITSLFSTPDGSAAVWKDVRRAPLFPETVVYSQKLVDCVLLESCPHQAAPLVPAVGKAPSAVDINAVSKKLTLDVIGKATLEMDWGFLDGSVEGTPLQVVPELIVE
eukprot:gene3568-13645_t